MRISSIKIAGFKSFFRPVTLTFPSNYVVLVGPNGCGKSNIIDAVRWVLGESSSSGLRSDSLEDTIFNGTENHPPAGRASIELTFKNSGSKGKFANQEYIRVRRSLERDKSSRYYINNSVCRRKDIEELFGGMGLTGKANYAVITQGAVHNLVESKPEHVRLLIEEAANITEYLQKRKESLTHIKNTRINLKQIALSLREILTRLRVLEKQAQEAKEYEKIRQELNRLKKELGIVLYQEMESKKEKTRQELDRMIARMGEYKDHANKIMTDKEKMLYRTSKSNLRCEKFLKEKEETDHLRVALRTSGEYNQKKIDEQTKKFTTLSEEEECKRKTILEESAQLEKWKKELAQLGDTDALEEEKESPAKNMQTYDLVEREWQETMTLVMGKGEETQELQHRLTQAETRLQFWEERLMQDEKQNKMRSLKEAQEELAKRSREWETLHRSIEDMQVQRRKQQEETENLLQQIRKQEQELIRIQTLLRELTEERLPQERLQFLKRLDITQPWSEQIQIPEGWEKAVDQVTEGLSSAHIVDKLDKSIRSLVREAAGDMGLIGNEKTETKEFAGMEPLASLLKGAYVPSLFNHIYPCLQLEKALELRSKLASHESMITPQGEWVGKNWALIRRGKKKEGNIFAKRSRRKKLEEERGTCLSEKERLQQKTEQLRAMDKKTAKEASKADDLLVVKNRHLDALNAEIEEIKTKERKHAGTAAMQRQKEELEEERMRIKKEITGKEREKGELLSRMSSLEKERTRMAAEITQAQAIKGFRAVKNSSEQSRREELLQQIASIERNLHNERERRKELDRQKEELMQEQKKEGREKEKIIQQEARSTKQSGELEENINRHRKEIHEYERRIEQEGRALTKIEKNIALLERDIAQRKEESQQLRLDLDDLMSRHKNLSSSTNQEIKMNSSDIREYIRQLERKLERVGEVNQLALRDYEDIKEEYEEKEAQQQEILAALKILERSVRRIDGKTRAKFTSTFKDINKKFREIFFQLTGGGTAYLEEYAPPGKENNGIRIIAHSRGRRKTSTSLLSGGEKTVVAISLIIAIFHLNPSPFCLMDEADAMLDDENVLRFNRMITDMSANIQFILITHNKATVEYARHLIGITMVEPGISQVVSVDMKQALELSQRAQA